MRCFFMKYKQAGYSDKYENNRFKRKGNRDLQKLQAE